MKRNRIFYVVIALVAFFVPYVLAQASGYWSTSGKFDGTGNPIVATGRDTTEIKGRMTFGEISKGYNVSLDEMAEAFQLPKDDVTPEKALNKVESDTFSVTKLRQWLDSQKSSSP